VAEWIPWTKGLPLKPEIAHLARLLNISRYEAACRCMAVWEWADENTADGNARNALRLRYGVTVLGPEPALAFAVLCPFFGRIRVPAFPVRKDEAVVVDQQPSHFDQRVAEARYAGHVIE